MNQTPFRISAAVPIGFMLALAAITFLVSPDRNASLPALVQLLLGTAIFFLCAFAIRNEQSVRAGAYLLAAGAIGIALLTLLGTDWAVVRLAALPELYNRIPALLRDATDQRPFHPRVMGMALAVVLPPCLALALFGRSRPLRLLAATGALAAAAVLPLTQAVQALLGLAVGLWVLAVWRTRWALLLPPLLLFALYWLGRANDLHALLLRTVALDDTGGIGVALRLDIWSRAWEMLLDMPLIGPGLNTFPIMVWHFYPGYLIGPELHAHNVLLQVGLDLGLPGLAAFITLLVAAAVAAVRSLRRAAGGDLPALTAGLAAGIAAYLGAGLIDNPWSSKAGILLWVLLGLLAGVDQVVGDFAPWAARSAGRHIWGALIWGLPALLVALALLLTPGVLSRNIALVEAQRLLAAQSDESVAVGDWEKAAAQLQQVAPASDSPHPFARLASVYAWQGDYARALTALNEQVLRDRRNTIMRYAPFEAIRRVLAGEEAGNSETDLLAVYGQWMARFPQRAEWYAATAVVYAQFLGDDAAARHVLERGLQQDAQPAGLLDYYLAQLPAAD